MGPFALLDLVGLDTSLAILDSLHAAFGDANLVAADRLRQMWRKGSWTKVRIRLLRLPSVASKPEGTMPERSKPWVMRTYSATRTR